MKLKIDNYTIETADQLNLKLTKEVDSLDKKTKEPKKVTQFIGWFGNLRDAVLRIIRDREVSMDIYVDLELAIKEYDRISQETLKALKSEIKDFKLKPNKQHQQTIKTP